ncbi:MAG: translation initiation factor IF-6 [Candidatus Methanoperedens sp.]|nr:translation initiation factor IF-6 [Candidatus Methanoperedens sp.]MCZ7369577.1 translation initiation factor IF-6 [Candidatus Methanoperedens sp.]
MERRLNISGTPVLGVFATCTEEFVFIPKEIPPETAEELEKSLGVKAISTLVGGSAIIGSLMRGNSNGVIAAGFILEREIRAIRKHTKAARLSGELNAAGNLILANDTSALVHPDISDKAVGVIKRTLGVDVQRGTIGGLKTVGMAGIATNKGVLVHPKVTPAEIGMLEKLFDLPVDIGTVNFGSPLVGSGLLANSKGYVAGEDTTGPEISRIEDTLGFE